MVPGVAEVADLGYNGWWPFKRDKKWYRAELLLSLMFPHTHYLILAFTGHRSQIISFKFS